MTLKGTSEILLKKAREKVLSCYSSIRESAGGIMDTEIYLPRVILPSKRALRSGSACEPSRDIYQQIYVTNRENLLMGYIELEDLVLQAAPKSHSFIYAKADPVNPDEDREEIATKMVHYGLMS